MKMVKLDDIRLDGGTQMRVVLNQQKVYDYLENMKEGDEFPPLETVFDGVTHWLTDGFHRWHAIKLLGVKEAKVVWKPGTQDDAIRVSLQANSKHGLPLTNDDKRKKVETALALPEAPELSDAAIARMCKVSTPFVSAIRRPEVKEQQERNRIKSAKKKAEKKSEEKTDRNPIKPDERNPIKPDPQAGAAPDEEEIKAAELAEAADRATMYKLLESDDALKTAHEEIKRLNHRNAQLETRLHGLMREKNEAIKMVKDLQKQLKAKK